jgi:hypothetical protein
VKTAHWIGLGLAFIPIPFVIYDAIMLRIWEAEWWLILVAIAFTATLCLLIYWAVRGIAKLVSLLWPIDERRHL